MTRGPWLLTFVLALGGCDFIGVGADDSSSSTSALDGQNANGNANANGAAAPAAATPDQPTMDARYANYRSPRRDQLFLYQGDLRNLGATPKDVARVMRPFDVVVLTNVIPARYAGPNAPRVRGRVEATSGTCMSDGLPAGWDATALVKAIRAENPNVVIYGYVPSTADLHVGAGAGCTSNLQPHQNYVCPNGTCSDFIQWVDAWNAIEAGDASAKIDGIYVDLLNEFYVHESTWANQAAYVHATRNAAGTPYKLLTNITAYNRAGEGYFYDRGGATVVTHSLSSVAFAAAKMNAGDAIYREGFLLVAGEYETAGFNDMMNELVVTYRTRGVRWAASASELGNTYVPGTHVSFATWQAAGWITAGSCFDGPTGESVGAAGRPLVTCSTELVAPKICGTQNNQHTYATYKQWADAFGTTVGAGGGMGFAFTEARLGVYTGVVPFCPND
jgi:hypothetical protein